MSDFASFLSLPWLDFPGVLIVIGSLTLPTIGVAYLFLRIRLRREDFLALFTDPAVGGPYLATRGQLIKRDANEAIEAYRSRVKAECTKFCLRQFKGEFGRLHWLLPLILAALLTWITITFLIQEAFGTPLKEETPLPIIFALLGGLLWSFYVVFRDYTQTDLSPTTFYWIAFRYVLAIALGSLASEVFATGFANVGAFVLAILPFEDTIRFIRSKIPELEAEKVELKLTSLQGLTPDNAERLKELGVQTIQQLAYADPLRLLLGSNLSARVLIDWMDQALLYVYLNDKSIELNACGIRGSIEMATVWEEKNRDELVELFSKRVGLTPAEFLYLVQTLNEDTQVLTVWKLWGFFDPNQTAQ